MSNALSDVAIAEFMAEGEEILERVSNILTKMDKNGPSQDEMDSLYRDMHTLKGSSQLFGLRKIAIISHALETSLDPVRKRKIALDSDFVDLVFKCLDYIGLLLKNISFEEDKNAPLKDQEIETLVSKLISKTTEAISSKFFLLKSAFPDENNNSPKLKEVSHEKKKNTDEVLETKEKDEEVELKNEEKKMEEKKINTNSDSGGENSSIRVQVTLLDRLMNLISEMVLVRNQVLQYANGKEDSIFFALTQHLDLVTSELQDSIMRTRMQPIGSVFSKFQRLVRDISKDLGKKIELNIFGQETELDKSLIESIKDPLTHIVRNSCDHGLETPDVRSKSGKKETGIINLKAYQEGGHVVIEVSDDGKGLNTEKVLAKAIENGVVTAENAKKLSEKEIQHLIFSAGLSTAEKVTSVSGRGVGMDVVRSNIEKIGGTIDLNSVFGKGTVIQLRIPLTLAIIPAMTIRLNQSFYVIPQVKIKELIRIDEGEGKNKLEKIQENLVLRLRGKVIPIVGLKDILKIDSVNEDKSYNIVILECDGGEYGLVVDEICDTKDIVVKPLPGFLKKLNVFSGSTIMGDGQVALILDVQGMAEKSSVSSAHQKNATDYSDLEEIEEKNSFEICDYLLFELNDDVSYCIPLNLVNRLEEFDISEVNYSGDQKLISYRDSVLNLIELDVFFNKQESSLPDKIVTIVVSRANKYYGLVVKKIVDLLVLSSSIEESLSDTTGIVGNLIGADKTIYSVVDSYAVVDEVFGRENNKNEKSREAIVNEKEKNVNANVNVKGKKILLAEDTPFFAKRIISILKDEGYDVTHAANGQIAFDKLNDSPRGTFDLLLSDIEMPILNGFDLMEKVRSIPDFSHLPSVAITTRFTDTDRKKGKEKGFTKYLEKLKSDELINELKSLFAGDIK